jgi:predicted Fe-S protein YdhL (DUF1289 family)
MQKCERLENEIFQWESVKAQQIAIKAKLSLEIELQT